MALDPQVQVLLDTLNQMGFKGISELAPDAAGVRALMSQLRVPADPAEVAEVRELSCPGPAGPLALRSYRPDDQARMPGLVWFHGGGWTIGDLDTADATCRELANAAGVLVVSVDYRLAPENPFPAAVEDCWAALQWIGSHAGELGVDANRLAVGGDSAGGNLAAVTALTARDAGGPLLRYQLLVYPATDARLGWPSLQENGSGYFMSREDVVWFYRQYAPPDTSDWHMSPLLAPDHAGLPPALIITAEYDPIRDEGEAYAETLSRAGVDAELRRYDGMVHGFFGMHATVDVAARAVREAGAALAAGVAG